MMQRIADVVVLGLFALYSGAVRLLASAIFSPFSGLHPLITLIPISLLLGIGMLWIFSKTSNQEAIRRVKPGSRHISMRCGCSRTSLFSSGKPNSAGSRQTPSTSA